jgi:copper(I)-binding protein
LPRDAVTIQASDAKRAPHKLELPANTLVELKPGESRIRMSGLVRRLKLGEHVPLTLIVRAADGKEQRFFINAEVRHRSPTEDELNPHGHGAHQHRK